MTDLLTELRSITDALDFARVDYALCGGVALAIYGIPRATIDIDMLVAPDQVPAAEGVLGQLGYRLAAAPMRLAGGTVTITRLVKPEPDSEDVLMVDLLHVTPALESVWRSRRRVAWDHGAVATVSRAGLVALKRLRGSGQDQDDIERLTG
ncbi:MAG: hypothetical protein OXJ62_00310, partial [Spirochaetaceae bacterium]|nr:hypothetical protein [Spirochaetaceae bacterium]